jgi:hypothetical protein
LSREVIDELIENLTTDSDSFPEVVEEIVSYGFADENELCEALDVEESVIDKWVTDSTTFSIKDYKKYAPVLTRFLKKIRKQYDTLYFKQSK